MKARANGSKRRSLGIVRFHGSDLAAIRIAPFPLETQAKKL
jgi:hypothetical protein